MFCCIHLIPCDFALALHLFPFLGSYGDFLFCFYFLFSFLRVIRMAACYFFSFTDLCPFADPFDRMRAWLFFLYLCRLIIIRLPLPVHVKVTLSSFYAVSQTCLGLPSCCYSFVGSFEFSSLAASFVIYSYAPLSLRLSLSFRLGVCARLWGLPLPSCLLVLPLPPMVSHSGIPPMRFVASYL